MRFDDRGRELPDDTPVDVPLNYKRPPTIQEMIRAHIRTELSRQAVDDGAESFEEADDFDVGSDDDPLSAYELQVMQEDRPSHQLLEAPQEKPAASADTAVAPANPAAPGTA